MTAGETLTWLRAYMILIDYADLYPSRSYVVEVFDRRDINDADKVQRVLQDSLLQKHLYGKELSSIAPGIDPVAYFYEHVQTGKNDKMKGYE